MKSARILACSLASLLLPAAAGAQTEYFVDVATGSDGNPGTCAQPFRSIGYAVNQATAGDTIRVFPGTYGPSASGEQYPIRLGGTRTHTGLRLLGAGPGRTIIDMEGRGGSTFFVSVGSDQARLSGFTVTNASTTDWWASAVTVGNYNGGNPTQGLEIDRVHFQSVNRGVVFFATTPTSSGCRVHDCLFEGMTNDGVNDFTSGSNAIDHCTFAGMLYLGMTLDSPSTIVANNIFWTCRTGIALAPAASGATVQDNVFFANTTHFTGNVNAAVNRFVDPLFINAATGDFRLQFQSPLVDTATSVSPTGAADVTGNPRNTDGDGNGTFLADVGAYEWTDSTLGITGTWGLGQNVSLDVSAPAGVAIILLSRNAANIFAPGFGNLLIDPLPGQLLPLAFVVPTVPGSFPLTLPNDQSLQCARIHMQALVVDPQLRVRLTNDRVEWLR